MLHHLQLGESVKSTQVFDKLIEEKFGFKLKITEDNIEKQSDSYTVLKVHTVMKNKKTASEQLGPKTPQKEKQQKTTKQKSRNIERKAAEKKEAMANGNFTRNIEKVDNEDAQK